MSSIQPIGGPESRGKAAPEEAAIKKSTKKIQKVAKKHLPKIPKDLKIDLKAEHRVHQEDLSKFVREANQ